jgi:DNA-binding CsgD family transcriptional regulator
VVDALSAAVILVTADRNVVYANPSAEAMLADGRILQQRHDGLIATEAAAMDELRAAIARCARGDLASDGDPVAIALGGADERLVAHVVSLARGARRQAGKLYGAVAGIFVHEAELRRPTLIQTVAKLYGLTPGETRVLFAMLEAGGVPQTAAALGVSDETVKSHLKHIFEKTDRSRQADLVKLIGEIANPMVG